MASFSKIYSTKKTKLWYSKIFIRLRHLLLAFNSIFLKIICFPQNDNIADERRNSTVFCFSRPSWFLVLGFEVVIEILNESMTFKIITLICANNKRATVVVPEIWIVDNIMLLPKARKSKTWIGHQVPGTGSSMLVEIRLRFSRKLQYVILIIFILKLSLSALIFKFHTFQVHIEKLHHKYPKVEARGSYFQKMFSHQVPRSTKISIGYPWDIQSWIEDISRYIHWISHWYPIDRPGDI